MINCKNESGTYRQVCFSSKIIFESESNNKRNWKSQSFETEIEIHETETLEYETDKNINLKLNFALGRFKIAYSCFSVLFLGNWKVMWAHRTHTFSLLLVCFSIQINSEKSLKCAFYAHTLLSNCLKLEDDNLCFFDFFCVLIHK